jgi:hypothetical protein
MAFDPLSIGLQLGGKVIDHFFPDPQKAAEAKLELLKLAQTGELAQMTGQMDINKAEAGTGSVFIAGWRPFVGWVCGTALAMNFIVGPLGTWISALRGHPTAFPTLDMTTMMPVLLGMLGLGAYRTYEKVQGAEGNRT